MTYRALRLGTGRGPVRLRLVDRAGLPPAGLQVRVSRDGFQPKDAVRDQGVPRDGLFETAHAYAGLAYVVVAGGDHLVAQIPVPVIDDRVTTCRVTPAPGGEARQQFELDVSNAHRRLFDILRRLKEQHDRLKVITDLKNHGEALAEVRHGLDVLDGELAVLRGELSRLRHEAQATDKTVGAVLDQCDIFVAEVRKRRDVLRQAEDDLEKAIDDEQKQAPLRDSFLALRRRAVTQQIDAEFDEAIKTYDEILMKYGEREEIRKKKDDLEKKWEIKSDAHRRARAFIYGPWTNLRSVDDIRTNLPKARDALAVCKRVGDRLTPLKILVTPTAAEIMTKALEEIEKSESDVDKLNLGRLQELNAELEAFIKDVSAFVRPEEKAP